VWRHPTKHSRFARYFCGNWKLMNDIRTYFEEESFKTGMFYMDFSGQDFAESLKS
jgi:hypothetical protein